MSSIEDLIEKLAEARRDVGHHAGRGLGILGRSAGKGAEITGNQARRGIGPALRSQVSTARVANNAPKTAAQLAQAILLGRSPGGSDKNRTTRRHVGSSKPPLKNPKKGISAGVRPGDSNKTRYGKDKKQSENENYVAPKSTTVSASEKAAVMRNLGVKNESQIKDALKAYQTKRGLKADGIIGRQTLSRMGIRSGSLPG